MKEDGFRNLVLAFLIAMFSVTASFADWTTFAPELEEFSVEVPVALDASIQKIDPAKPDDGRTYFNRFEGTYFYIFSELPTNRTETFTVENFVDAVRGKAVKSWVGLLESKNYSITDGFGYVHQILCFEGRQRKYCFQTISPTTVSESAKRFISSVGYSPKAPAAIKAPSTDKSPADNTAPTTPSSGFGFGSSAGLANPEKPLAREPRDLKDRGPNEGVFILSKPRPNYTDFARLYEIQGKVLVRVVFRADGRIGDVIVVEGLPFGLTNSAVAAAKGIVFEPAIRNGVPYTVTKTVQYSFSIY